jgi:hypothetical protein
MTMSRSERWFLLVMSVALSLAVVAIAVVLTVGLR